MRRRPVSGSALVSVPDLPWAKRGNGTGQSSDRPPGAYRHPVGAHIWQMLLEQVGGSGL